MFEAFSYNEKLWMIVSFLIFAFFAFKGIRHFLENTVDERIAKIKDELNEAENLHVEAQELLAQYQRKHANAMKEAEDIVENAEMYAAKIRKQAKKELRENLDRREAQLQERISRMKENAMVEIQRYAAEISIDATREIILKEFDKKADKALVDESISSLDKRLH